MNKTYQEQLKVIPAELAEISGPVDDQFSAACKIIEQYQASKKAPLVIVSDLRALANFIENIY
jgi:hypothetical protein